MLHISVYYQATQAGRNASWCENCLCVYVSSAKAIFSTTAKKGMKDVLLSISTHAITFKLPIKQLAGTFDRGLLRVLSYDF